MILYIFTASYPFGTKETYIKEELLVLANKFDKIIIFPHYYNNKDKTVRSVPKNVIVHEPALPISKGLRIYQAIKGLFLKPKLSLFLNDFCKNKIYKNSGHVLSWSTALIDYLSTIGSPVFNRVKKIKKSKLYFYWGVGWSYIILNLDKSNKSHIRLHGGDVFLERHNGYFPMRKVLFDTANILFPISSKLAVYLNERFLIPKNKIKVSYLGIKANKNLNKLTKKNSIVLVSCSNAIKLKRIDMIIDALSLIKVLKIEWIHFGDGPELNNLISYAKKKLPKNINYIFKKRMPNIEILKFYNNNSIDAFVNVSKHEGLPFSIIEAMLYGIPCVATDVGATSEIVNVKNGELISENFKILDLMKIILKLKSNYWIEKRKFAKKTAVESFNSEINYLKLSNFLYN